VTCCVWCCSSQSAARWSKGWQVDEAVAHLQWGKPPRGCGGCLAAGSAVDRSGPQGSGLHGPAVCVLCVNHQHHHQHLQMWQWHWQRQGQGVPSGQKNGWQQSCCSCVPAAGPQSQYGSGGWWEPLVLEEVQ